MVVTISRRRATNDQIGRPTRAVERTETANNAVPPLTS